MEQLLRISILMVALAGPACRARHQFEFDEVDTASMLVPDVPPATQVEYVELDESYELENYPPPRTVLSEGEPEYWHLSLEEAVQIALENSEVISQYGARVVGGTSLRTSYDPAIREADPNSGVEAALTAFDTQFSTGLFWDKTNNQFNNILVGSGASSLRQLSSQFRSEMTKITATGTQFAFRNITDYSRNNISSLFQLFPSAYSTRFEVEFRQPLLQGAGVEFNRIAGPHGRAGAYNGVLLARLNTDISLADFEAGIRDLIRDIERAYWDLYFAYQNLESRKIAREAAHRTWLTVDRRFEEGEVSAREKDRVSAEYWFFHQQVIDALGGSAFSGAVVTTSGGVLASERRLRALLGISHANGRLIQPSEEPTRAQHTFDWHESLAEAVWRRVELRAQRLMIKRRELELVAARHFTKMRLDVLGQYRWRGFGDDLFGKPSPGPGPAFPAPQPSSAFDSLFQGNLQDWFIGLELKTPVGNRLAHTAVRHAELQLRRERVRYEEVERTILLELEQAFSELDRSYTATRTQYNRRVLEFQQLEPLQRLYDEGEVSLEKLLDAQRRATEAESDYFRTLADYNRAVSGVFLARGGLLEHFRVYLTEGLWCDEAYDSAVRLQRRFRLRHMDYGLPDTRVSAGPYPQVFEPAEASELEEIETPLEPILDPPSEEEEAEAELPAATVTPTAFVEPPGAARGARTPIPRRFPPAARLRRLPKVAAGAAVE